MIGFALAVSLSALQASPALAAPQNSCQGALGPVYGGAEEADLPSQVDGSALADASALRRLRAQRGEALIVVKGGRFAGADFRAASLHNICFLDTDLTGSDWRGADASGVGFVRADLTGARLAGADLGQILIREATLAGVDASGADMSGGRLDGGWAGSLENLRLDGADLSRFQFDCGITLGDGCPLDRNVSLRRADLSGARIGSYWLIAEWAGARIDRTEVALHQLPALSVAEIAGPLIVRGAEASVELSPQEYRTILAHVRPEAQPGQPAFDCARARTPVERLICSEEGQSLRPLDREVAALYRRAVASDPSLAAGQRAWLAERDRCAGEGIARCVETAYRDRRAALAGRLAPPWERTGRHFLFVAPELRFDGSFRSDPLYRRLLPVIVGSASARLAVRVNADGSLDARGSAIGGNAHLCSLAADGLRADPDTGWYSVTPAPNEQDPPAWRGRAVPVLLLLDEGAEVYENGRASSDREGVDPRAGDYASCGARAGFEPLELVPVSEEEARAMFESLAA